MKTTIDKHAGEETAPSKVIAKNTTDGNHENGIAGNNPVQIMNNAGDNEQQRQKELAHDRHLNETGEKIKRLDHKTKISDTAEIKQLKDDYETVNVMNLLPAEQRTAEFTPVVEFYYKRMNENIKRLYAKLVDKVGSDEEEK